MSTSKQAACAERDTVRTRGMRGWDQQAEAASVARVLHLVVREKHAVYGEASTVANNNACLPDARAKFHYIQHDLRCRSQPNFGEGLCGEVLVTSGDLGSPGMQSVPDEPGTQKQ